MKILTFISLFFLIAFCLQAEKLNLTQEQVDKLVTKWNLEPNGRHVKQMLGQQASNDWEGKLSKLKITKHVKGRKGERYTTPQQLESEVKRVKITDQDVKFGLKQLDQQIENHLKSYQKAQELPQCEENNCLRLSG